MASLHDFKGNCDLCSLEADSEVAEVVGLDCSYAQCPEEASLYHQACLEKYLKSIRCERNRKIGFPCPRGSGKNTRFTDKCKGKVMKSHPVTIRSEGNKKRRQAELDSLRTVVPEATKSRKDKEKEKQAAPLDRKAAAKAAKMAKASAKVPPPKSEAELKREAAALQLAHRDKLRAEISAHKSGSLAAAKLAVARQQPPVPASKEVKTLEEWEAERNGSSARLERFGSNASSSSQHHIDSTAPTASNAWSRPRAGSGQAPSPVSLSSAPSLSHPAPIRASSTATASSLGLRHSSGGFATLGGGWGEESAADMEGGGGGGGLSEGSSQPATPPSSSFALGSGGAGADPNQPIPGMVLASPEAKSAAKLLTKAQRKNAKRAEKKAAARHDEGGPAGDDAASALSGAGSHSHTAPSLDVAGSHLSDAELYAYVGGEGGGGFLGVGLSSGAAPAAAEQDVYGVGGHAANASVESEMDVAGHCMRCIVQRKLQTQVAELQALGFADSAAARAVVVTGGNLEAAVTLLLAPDGGEAALAGAQHSEAVDISEELSAVQAIRVQYNFPAGVVEAVVIDHDGDIDAALASLQQSAAEEDAAGVHAAHHAQHAQHADSNGMASLFHGTAFDHHLQAQQQQRQQQYSSAGGGSASAASAAAPAAASHAETSSWTAGLLMAGGTVANGGGGGGGWNSLLGLEGVTQAALSAVHGSEGLSPLTMPSPSLQPASASFLQPDSQTGGARSSSLFGDALGLLGITSAAPAPPLPPQHAGDGSSLWGGSGLGALGGFSSASGPGSPLAAAYDPIHVHPQHAQHAHDPSHHSSSFFAPGGPQSPLYAHQAGTGGGSSNAHSAHSSVVGGGSWFDAPVQQHHHQQQQQMPSAAAAWAPLGSMAGAAISSPMRGSLDGGSFFGGLHHPLGGVGVAGAGGDSALRVPPPPRQQQQQQQMGPSVEETELNDLMATLMCR